MATDAVWFSIFYAVFCMCIVAPPSEVVQAGLSLAQIFERFMDKESQFFVEHNMQKVALTMLVHCALPLGEFRGRLSGLTWFVSLFPAGACLPSLLATRSVLRNWGLVPAPPMGEQQRAT